MLPASKAKVRTKTSRRASLMPIIATVLVLAGLAYAVSLFQ